MPVAEGESALLASADNAAVSVPPLPRTGGTGDAHVPDKDRFVVVRVIARRAAGVFPTLVPGRQRLGHPSWNGCDERSADGGAATIWMVGGIAALMVVMTGMLWFSSAVETRHRVEGAADLGALAAAVSAADGESQACAEARWVVERMGAELLSCRLSGWDALVEVGATFELFGSAAAHARAGPVELDR